jgi:hypothetical protein
VLGSGLAGVGNLDLATLTSVSATYLMIALTAAYLPARRTFRLDAMRARTTE